MGMANNDYIDQVARLLATENISIQRAPVQTAAFDLLNRTMIIPTWKNLTPATEQLMVIHETGHAKYTPLSMFDNKEVKTTKHLKHYVNVVEDARIERYMRREYPGVRRLMLQGYEDLEKSNFFGTQFKSEKELNALNLIDRINLYFKLGASYGIKFSDEELEFVNRIEVVQKPEDVTQLAKDILLYERKKFEEMTEEQQTSQKQKQKNKGNQKGQKQKANSQETGEDDGGEGDPCDQNGQGKESDEGEGQGSKGSNGDEGESNEGNGDSDGDEGNSDSQENAISKGTPSSTPSGKGISAKDLDKSLDDALRATTEESYQEKLSKQVDYNARFEYKDLNLKYGDKIIIPYKTVISETVTVQPYVDANQGAIAQFRRDSDKVVAYLIKEFELRKSAALNKRATISKTGMLDMRKIFGYQLKDDIFRRVTQLPQGKNHGMIFLVDWSASMGGTIKDTLHQTLNLVMFCRRMQIPFQVLAFTNGYRNAFYGYGTRATAPNEAFTGEGQFNLLELMSSDMSNAEFNTMYGRMYSTKQLTDVHNYRLSSTPLNHALMFLAKHVPEWQKAHNVEKQTVVCLTDGEGSLLNWTFYGNTATVILRDPVTKRETKVDRMNSNEQSRLLINLIKQRSGAKVIGFHLCSKSDIMDAFRTHADSDAKNDANAAVKSFDSDGYYQMSGTAHDAMFLVYTRQLGVSNVNAADGVSDTDSADVVARTMTRNMNKTIRSRILLNKFIETMA